MRVKLKDILMLGSGHIGIWLGRRAEKEVINEYKKHLDKIFTIVNKFKVFIDTYCEGNVEESNLICREIVELEKEADLIKKNIIDDMMKTSLHPMDQDEIIRIVLTSDDIAAHLKSATRKMQYTNPNDVPEPIKRGLILMVNTLVDEVAALIETIDALSTSRSSVIDKAEKTERLEEKIDDMRMDLLSKVFKWGDVAEHVSDWLMIKEAVENIESSSDKVEDTADLIRSIAILRSVG